MEVVWSLDALLDIDAAYRFIAERNPLAAQHMVDRLTAAGDSLATFPNRGRPSSLEGYRELVAVRPYVIVYRVMEDRVRIIRVWHGAQRRDS